MDKKKAKPNKCPICNKKSNTLKAIRYSMLTPDDMSYDLYIKCSEHGWQNIPKNEWRSWYRHELQEIKDAKWVTV